MKITCGFCGKTIINKAVNCTNPFCTGNGGKYHTKNQMTDKQSILLESLLSQISQWDNNYLENTRYIHNCVCTACVSHEIANLKSGVKYFTMKRKNK